MGGVGVRNLVKPNLHMRGWGKGAKGLNVGQAKGGRGMILDSLFSSGGRGWGKGGVWFWIHYFLRGGGGGVGVGCLSRATNNWHYSIFIFISFFCYYHNHSVLHDIKIFDIFQVSQTSRFLMKTWKWSTMKAAAPLEEILRERISLGHLNLSIPW